MNLNDQCPCPSNDAECYKAYPGNCFMTPQETCPCPEGALECYAAYPNHCEQEVDDILMNLDTELDNYYSDGTTSFKGSSNDGGFGKMRGICDGSSRGQQIAMWRHKNYGFCEKKCSENKDCNSFLVGTGHHMYKGTCELYNGKPSHADGNGGWECYVGQTKTRTYIKNADMGANSFTSFSLMNLLTQTCPCPAGATDCFLAYPGYCQEIDTCPCPEDNKECYSAYPNHC